MRIANAQSLLFVPADRPERWSKALASGADMVILDLEDAIGPQAKEPARAAVAAYYREGADPRIAVRINPLVTPLGLADLLALAPAPPATLVLPKVESAGLIAAARGALPQAALVAMIESPAGLAQAAAMAAAPGVAGLMLGGVDYAAELGVAPGWDALFLARAGIAGAAAGAGLAAVDVPHLALEDAAGCEDEARRVCAMGFTAKAAIHPAQIAPIHAAFRPTPAELAEAREALAAFAAAGGGVARFKGKLLEAPVVRRHQRILAIAETMHA